MSATNTSASTSASASFATSASTATSTECVLPPASNPKDAAAGTITADRPVKDIVLDFPAARLVFSKYHLETCCKAWKPLAQACVDASVSVDTVLVELREAVAAQQARKNVINNTGGQAAPLSMVDPRKMSTPELISHIISIYHTGMRSAFDDITPMTARVARVHGPRDDRLVALAKQWALLVSILEKHLEFEETILFPHLMAASAKSRSLDVSEQTTDMVKKELESMHHEHVEQGEILKKIRHLADDFVPPAHACVTYKLMLSGLDTFEQEIQMHVMLESNVLLQRFYKYQLPA